MKAINMGSLVDPEFSEIAFMTDVVRELAQLQQDPIAPIFPTQVEEGGGRNVRLIHHPISPLRYPARKYIFGLNTASGVISRLQDASTSAPEGYVLEGFDGVFWMGKKFRPLLLQFKTSTHVSFLHRGITEYKSFPGFPYHDFYRMKLRTVGIGNQHSLVVNAANRGRFCYYCTPNYHLLAERSRHYSSQQTLVNCSFFDPRAIGAITDGKSHHISFKPAQASYWRFSDSPVQVDEGKINFALLRAAIDDIEEYEFSIAGLMSLYKLLQDVALEGGIQIASLDLSRDDVPEFQLIEEIARFSSQYFDSTFQMCFTQAEG